MASTTKRNLYFDNAKLILIFLVVFGHVISPLKGMMISIYSIYSDLSVSHACIYFNIRIFLQKDIEKRIFNEIG